MATKVIGAAGRKDGRSFTLPVEAGQKILINQIVAINLTTYADGGAYAAIGTSSTTRVGDVIMGIALDDADNSATGAATGNVSVPIGAPPDCFEMGTNITTPKEAIGLEVYLVDNVGGTSLPTVNTTSTNQSPVGYIRQALTTTKVLVSMAGVVH